MTSKSNIYISQPEIEEMLLAYYEVMLSQLDDCDDRLFTLIKIFYNSPSLTYLRNDSIFEKTDGFSEMLDAFYFEKNLQGDVVAVYNENGVKVLSYTYDAWGNVKSYVG